MSPLVSVCIPTYNGDRYVEDALRSVLAQTLEDLEVVVADDASPDRTLEVVGGVEDRRVRVLASHRNLGPGPNWTRAVEAARGRYVKVMGQDDLLHASCLARQVEALDRHGRVAFVAARRDVIGERGEVLVRDRGLRRLEGRVGAGDALRAIVRSGTNPVGEPVAVLMRAEAVSAVGAFDGAKEYVIDLDYWVRLLDVGDLFGLPETLCAFRVSPSSWSVALARQQSRQVRALYTELHEHHPGTVRRSDLLAGRLRAGALAALRRIVYASPGVARRLRGA